MFALQALGSEFIPLSPPANLFNWSLDHSTHNKVAVLCSFRGLCGKNAYEGKSQLTKAIAGQPAYL